MTGVAVFAWGCTAASLLWAVDPNALESAYWRFEEGENGATVADPDPDPNGDTDPVVDSLNNNNLRKSAGAPTYTNDVAPTPLKSGQPNNLAMSFAPNSALLTSLRNIDNGTIEPGNGFTIEAAFRANSVGGVYQGILSKQNEPDEANPHPIFGNLPTVALKIRGDTSQLMFEQYDVDKNLVNISSVNPIIANNWYYAAAVNDGSQLSLYLDSNDGNGYQLQSSAPVSGAIYMGDPNNPDEDYEWPDWFGAWSVGRGYFAGDNDWFNGVIDEVRISNSALNTTDFLFAPGDANGDFNGDGVVDAADYVMWRKTGGSPDDYSEWQTNFARTYPSGTGASTSGPAVPEPATVSLLLFAAIGWCLQTPRKNRKSPQIIDVEAVSKPCSDACCHSERSEESRLGSVDPSVAEPPSG